MERFNQKEQINKKVPHSKIFSVPFSIEEIAEKINISIITRSKLSKEEIINKAIKFHLLGNINEARKYY